MKDAENYSESPEQYGRLIESHRAGLQRHAYRLTHNVSDADDLVQETLLRAYTRHHLLVNPAAIGSWLYAIQLNLFRNTYRHTARIAQRFSSIVSLDDERTGELRDDSGEEPERIVLRSEQYERTLSALARLPMPYQEVVRLCDIEGETYEEIARDTGVPIGTVRSRLNRGRLRLRRSLAAWQ